MDRDPITPEQQELAKKLLLELCIKKNAVFYTDQYEGYPGIIAATQHQAIAKHFRKTSHIERLNCTLRQRISQLVRATLSFSKKLTNHIGAIESVRTDYSGLGI